MLYILVGEDYVKQQLKLKKICKDYIVCDTALEAINKSNGLFNTNYYMVKNDMNFLKDEKHWKFNKNSNVILIYDSFGRYTKFKTYFKSNIEELTPFTENQIIAILNKQYGLTMPNAKLLSNGCSNDCSKVMFEIDKIQHYSQYNQIDINKAFMKLYKSGFIHIDAKDAIFDLVNAITSRNKDMTYNYLQDCKAIGEAELVIFKNLHMQFIKILIIQNGGTPNNTQPYIINILKRNANKYSNQEIVNILKLLLDIDLKIKTQETTNYQMVEYFISKVI